MQIEMKCLKVILLPWTGLECLKSKFKSIRNFIPELYKNTYIFLVG